MKLIVPTSFENIDMIAEVEARPVKIFPWIQTAIHKHLNFEFNHEWVVAEVTTGTAIDSGRTQKDAISMAKEKLELQGEKRTKTAIKKFIRERKQYNF